MPAASQAHASRRDGDCLTSRASPRPFVSSPARASHNLPSDAALFIENLRFLDLDLLPDWPKITVQTFRSTKDARLTQKDRVRCAEWVLYNLFALWDPNEAQSRLLPYFPAHEPLQSIKLRAALYQSLNQLKLNGILRRDCALRKSMLDDCQGERFEELLFGFSTVVLRRKLVGDKSSSRRAPAAQQLTVTDDRASWINEESSEMLLWTHKKFLTSTLQKRHSVRQDLQQLEKTFVDKRTELDLRRRKAEKRVGRYEQALTKTEMDAMRKNLRDHCTGDPDWLSIIVNGDPDQARGPLLEDSFDNIWTKASKGAPISYPLESKGLLATLDKTVKAQQARLASMRLFQHSLSQRNKDLVIANSPLKSPRKSPRKPQPPSPTRRRVPFPAEPRLRLTNPRAATENVVGVLVDAGGAVAQSGDRGGGEFVQMALEDEKSIAQDADVFRTRDKLRMSLPRGPRGVRLGRGGDVPGQIKED